MTTSCEENDDHVDREAVELRQSLVLRSKSLDQTHLLPPDASAAIRNLVLRTSPLYKIVLTGGPCGGKTTALARLSSFLSERGFEVFTVPEAFSILASNGFSFDYFGVEGMPACVQETVMDLQMSLEDGFERVLRARGRQGVILCDRGLMDGSAYMDSDEWDSFMRSRGVSSAEMREGRYNAVFHLVTAAEGAERYYTLENNEVRTESAEEARILDGKTQMAWVGHPNLHVFDNSTDFEGKLTRLVQATAKLVGLPSDLERVTTKFLLGSKPILSNFPPSVKYHIFDVEKVYLVTDSVDEVDLDPSSHFSEEYSFVRKRLHLSRDGRSLGTSYGLTTVKITRDEGKHIEVKRIISAREYTSAVKSRDVTRHIVRQRRISFLYNLQSFNIHIYKEPVDVEDLCILHAQAVTYNKNSEKKIDVPKFLNVKRKISNTREDEIKFGAFNISRIEKFEN